jgi:hypothetical protein
MLRRRFGLVTLLLLVAALAVSGIAASGASAAFVLTETKCEGGALIAFCWSKEATSPLFELTGEEEFEALPKAGTEIALLFKLGTEGLHINCTDAHAVGKIVQTAPLETNYSLKKVVITFSGCTLETPIGTKCKVPVEKSTANLIGTPSSAEAVTFTPEAGSIFIEFEISNNGTETCPATLKGIKKVTGEQVCDFAEPGADQTSKEFLCLLESALLVAEQAAELHLTLIVKPINLGADFWDVSSVA